MSEILKLNVVKTNCAWYITDCLKNDGYSWNYHQTQIPNYYFDGEKASDSFLKNWYKIKPNPICVQTRCQVPHTNYRYELIDTSLQSEKLPLVILRKDKDKFSESVIDALYKSAYDKHDPILTDVVIEFCTLMEVEDFYEPSTIAYKALGKRDFTEAEYKITNANISHQNFDKMIFPEIMLHTRPCSISSKMLFDIVRKHIKDNINNKVAKISSDYDFCFEVKKVVPLIEPRKFSYTNPFARTKRERNKVQFGVSTFKEISIFEMTHAQSKYDKYTVIPEMFANSESELKEKLDDFLEDLTSFINEPLCQCEHCNGTGYSHFPSKFDTNNKIN